jgi:hypothetical protein
MILGTLRRKPPLSSAKGKATCEEDEDDSVTESESDDGDSDIVERKVTGWVYVGSHNFTTAAWGSFQAKSTAFTPVFAVSLRSSKSPWGCFNVDGTTGIQLRAGSYCSGI